jgi:hypothetical protein
MLDEPAEEIPPGNPIDMAIHRRVGRPALMRKLVMAAQAVVDALGRGGSSGSSTRSCSAT